jgi:DNA helicase-2/ATP-dependent DNA helicase PcrA
MFKLNKQQQQAVRHKSGPLLIIAGAGTGKTTVVTERIKFLIEKKLAKPSEILALTFTDKAAREMEERVDVAMPYGYTQMWISTFHSFCDKVLRQEALHIGLDPKYKLMTQAESVQFIRENLFEFDLDYFRPRGNPTKFVDGMLRHFSRLQDEDVTPGDYASWVEGDFKKGRGRPTKEETLEREKLAELSSAYKTYGELKVKGSVMDFGDLIVKTLQLFSDRTNVLKEYKEKFKYVLVDEFQDTNYAQNELAILLAGRGQKANLTVTGDDNQSIYRFRGAAVSNILQFKKVYPKAKVVTLKKNYRSTQKILDRAYDLIQFNNPDTLEVKLGIDKNLISAKEEEGEDIVFIHKDRVENEADQAAKTITELREEKNYKWSDFAILVRANNHSEAFIRAFQRRSVPYQFLGPGRLFKQPEIVDLIAFLRVLYDFDDSVSLYRVLSHPHFEIAARDLIKIGNYARRFNLSYYETCRKIDDVFVASQTKKKVKHLSGLIDKNLKLVKKESAGQLLYFFLEDSGLLQKLLNPDTAEAEKRAANISKLFDKLKTYEVDHEDASVQSVVDWIDLSTELGESPLASDTDWGQVDAVNILTVHSAKGLEFPVVFLVNLVSRRFPTDKRREQIPIPEDLIKETLPQGDYHQQEERRLFYVGMTRAMDELYFTAANYYGEGKREKKLSPFIFEALGEGATASESAAKGEQLSFMDYDSGERPLKESERIGLPPVHVDFLSYSQIQTFKICPLHYKLRYIYKIPTPPTSSQSFGNSFHLTMKAFYEAVIKGDKPTVWLINRLLKESWISEGYLSKSHEKGSFKKAKKYLKYYLKNTFDPKVLPEAMEQPFLVKLNGLRVGGKIDRIDVQANKLHIIDYKTAATPLTQKQADDDLQLSVYALAATTIPEAPFNRKPENVKLSLVYFEKPTMVTTTRNKKQIEKAKETILKYKDEIEKSDFKCSKNYLCRNCEYKLFCSAEE